MNTQPSEGAVRAAVQCMRLSGRIYGDIPDELLAQWGAVQDMAKAIDRETGTSDLIEAAQFILWELSSAGTKCAGKERLHKALSRHTSTQGEEGKL